MLLNHTLRVLYVGIANNVQILILRNLKRRLKLYYNNSLILLWKVFKLKKKLFNNIKIRIKKKLIRKLILQLTINPPTNEEERKEKIKFIIKKFFFYSSLFLCHIYNSSFCLDNFKCMYNKKYKLS